MKRLALCLLQICLPLVFMSCGKDSEERVYNLQGQIMVDGLKRTFLLDLPPHYYDSAGFDLVIALHGTGGNADQCKRDYGWSPKASQAGFLVAYPNGIRSNGPLGIRTWNAGGCCGYAQQNQVNDVKFISMLIDYLADNYRVNRKRVYVTGMSNGAMLSYRLACEVPGKIAAVAPVSGTLMSTSPCNPSRPVPLLHIHSELDTLVPYQGGIGIGGYYFTPVDSALQLWAGIDKCSNGPETVTDNEKYTVTRWSNCQDETTVIRYLTKDGGHSWPGGLKARPGADNPSTAINATDVIWDFFRQYTLR
ncbi:PHB depolymerase family esterase [uncultured Chitinophaga sp.]|jgi:Poly(3-hydroxybutyrate) depolymerase|uniref:extracellular catalytic domain type 1 short-chain-length polyhydroxyalkanoate depolymerase n=1 Tax=uncultured Chitinophaga sp. TaxID=339340 RepID=UPI002616608F|nr:PHB depolymerase family esterase [uncultured Chitinophaga sp.]